ncbi:rhombosortase [Aliidiomarina iranensis]|uniref:Rhombosortase n=1 Tax=Aliidiomarina iranensis TaxID=1434071 RepID=A0A432W231_9GAMM|nr:rhombosortase [Aliidiomarina iranensis]RUO23284.1 rhombosortase [Aliidiomarina iranensis]
MQKTLKWWVAQWQYFLFIGLLLAIWQLQPMWMAYDREAMLQGQWWRLLTGQFLHLSFAHALGNILGLGVVWLLFADHWRGWRFVWLVPICVLGSNAGMLFHPQIENYVGFSGALYGLIAFGALMDWFHRIPYGGFITLGLTAKVSYEYFLQPIEFLALNDLSLLAVEAHFYGVLTGFCMAFIIYLLNSGKSSGK